jgi:hypothetical protein
MSTQLLEPTQALPRLKAQPSRKLSAIRRPGGAVRAARAVLSSRMKTVPAIFLPIAWLRENHKRTLIRRTSDLVVEGYWRCGNHFATYAFIQSQPGPVHVAHHFHAPAQLRLAAKWKVPAVLLVREPMVAVASATVFLEHDDPAPLLDFYNTFHSSLLPCKARMVISDFPRTIGDFASVIQEVNEKFGRQFALYHGTDAEEEQIRTKIKREHAANMDGNAATLPLPSADKERRKQPIIERIVAGENRSRLERAQELYNTLLSA